MLRRMKKASELKERKIAPCPGEISADGAPRRATRVIAITSGKGGVGKTNIAANLAYHLSRMKKKTLVLDADMGLANIDVIWGSRRSTTSITS
jgi:Septum formation inhibitor-activating ATPase